MLDDPVPAHEKINLIDQYLSVLLLIFIDAGLVEVRRYWLLKGRPRLIVETQQALVSVAADSKDATTSKKVSLLMGEILQLANRVLPLSYAAHAQVGSRLPLLARAESLTSVSILQPRRLFLVSSPSLHLSTLVKHGWRLARLSRLSIRSTGIKAEGGWRKE